MANDISVSVGEEECCGAMLRGFMLRWGGEAGRRWRWEGECAMRRRCKSSKVMCEGDMQEGICRAAERTKTPR